MLLTVGIARKPTGEDLYSALEVVEVAAFQGRVFDQVEKVAKWKRELNEKHDELVFEFFPAVLR